MIQIPGQSRQFSQPNNTDYLGTLFATKNCNFETNQGTIRLGERLLLNTGTADVASINSYPVGFKYFNNGTTSDFYTAAGASNVGYAFKASAIDGNFTKVTTSGAPAVVDSTTSDIALASLDPTSAQELCISSSSDQKLYYLNASNAWSTINSVGSAGYATMLCNFGNRMYASVNGNQIQSWNSAHTLVSPNNSGTDKVNTQANTCVIPNQNLIITCMRASSLWIWICTVDTKGGNGYIFKWNGADTQVTSQYRIEASGALACVIKNDYPIVMDSNGGLLVWNGYSFVRKTGIYRRNNKPFFNPFNQTNQRFIHPNGMSLIKNEVNILLDLTNYDVTSHGGTQEDCNPSGIWVYDENTNSLRHKYSFGNTKSDGTINDYGQFRIFGAGGLSEILTAQSPITTDGTFLAGCSYYTDATTTTSGIFYENIKDTLAKCGYFITEKISAGADKSSITDLFNKAFISHEKFLNATDRMVVKYRTVEDAPTEATITWVSTTQFTSTGSLASYVAGDEVEITQGVGAGLCSHITSISVNAGTYTVNVDETYTGATGTAKARFAKWAKAGTIQDAGAFDEVPLATVGTWIQLKVMMFWTGANEFASINIVNSPSEITK